MSTEKVVFNGFEVFPVGEAKLYIEKDVLRVDNIGDSGLDGVLVKFDCKDGCKEDSHTIHFGDLSSIAERKGVLKTATLRKNFFGQVATSFESFKWYDEKMDKVMVGYNPSLLPEKFTFLGTLNGKTVFEIDSSELNVIIPPIEPDKLCMIIPLVVVVAAGKALLYIGAGVATAYLAYQVLKDTKKTTTTTTTTDANGNVTTTTTVTEDPEPFEIIFNEQTFIIDEFGIKYDMDISKELIGHHILDTCIVGEQITGYNLSSFEITSIG